MDIIYLVGEGCSKCDDNELRYSLRSIEKYGKNVNKVYVAGYCPEWLSDEICKVPCKQIYDRPQNIIQKHINMLGTLLYTIDNTDISNKFLVSMDDHFYIRETDFDNYPIYAKKVLDNAQLGTKRNPPTKYGQFILKTKKLLEKMNLPTYFFTLHRNMHISKDIMNECRDILENIIDQEVACEPIVFLLNYQYKQQPFEFVTIKDIKIRGENMWWKVNPKETEVFSTYNFEVGSKLDTLIGNLFPEKSKYEK